MAWSGGTFTRTNGVNSGATTWATDAAASVKIRADRHDTHDQDLATGINQCLNKDGSNYADALNLGHATDTTFTRPAAGRAQIEGREIVTAAASATVLGSTITELNKCDDSAAAVASYVSGMRTYMHVDGGHATTFSVSTNVTELTYESVGPTGSSATNIWTAMDDIPAGATMAIIYASLTVSASGADVDAEIALYARQTGSAVALSAQQQILRHVEIMDDDAAGSSTMGAIIVVPLDSSRRFDTTYNAVDDDSVAITYWLKGFIL